MRHLGWIDGKRNARPDYPAEEYHPDKISVLDFEKIMMLYISGFTKNMQQLDNKDLKYPEDWLGMFAAWSEIIP